MRLFLVLEAAGGGSESGCFDFGPGAGESKLGSTNGISERKTNRSSSDSFVIFFFFRVLYVKWGLYYFSI